MKQLIPRFLETIPAEIEEGILYISMNLHTASHKCPCGCGHRVVTPLSSAGWILLFDGKRVSLDPSIGNWSKPCQSHYWITNNEIEWAPQWSKERIARGLLKDKKALEEYYSPTKENQTSEFESVDSSKNKLKKRKKNKKGKNKNSKKKNHKKKKRKDWD
jgi:hypothetical protein